MAVLGWFLIVLGVFALTVGLLGGAREVLLHPAAGKEGLGPLKLIELFLEILKKGGWQALTGVGFILLVLGLILVGSDVFSSSSTASHAAAVLSYG
jgi:hypothetical protein